MANDVTQFVQFFSNTDRRESLAQMYTGHAAYDSLDSVQNASNSVLVNRFSALRDGILMISRKAPIFFANFYVLFS